MFTLIGDLRLWQNKVRLMQLEDISRRGIFCHRPIPPWPIRLFAGSSPSESR